MAEGFLNQISVFGRVYDITSNYDTELDENSENAVQNKVLTGALNETNETLEELESTVTGDIEELQDQVSKIIPIEIEDIDDLFGL
jgi:hypothetical protein